MMQSVLILGRQPALGLAELESLYGAAAVTPVSARPGGPAHSTAPHAAGLSLHAHDVNFGRLGGSTRLAHVVALLPTTDWNKLSRQLPDLALELSLTLPPEGKIQLGLSVFGIDVSPARLNALGLTIKKTLRSRAGRSVRVTPNPTPELNTAAVFHNHLTGPTGVELLLIAHGSQTIVARTTQVQDIDSYTLRDRGRPKRDARVGMLPPKLAQIIINLASNHAAPNKPPLSPDNPTVTSTDGDTAPAADAPRPPRILDPFCGTGVLLQEALLMGYDAYGTDLEQRMVDYTGENLDWLDSKFGLGQVQMLIEPGDATKHSWQPPIDQVATETYLGRAFTAQPSAELLAQTCTEANLIIKKFLQNIHGQLAPGTPLCLAVPAWATGHAEPGTSWVTNSRRFKHLPLIDQLGELGYNRTDLEHVRDTDLLYYREDQIVARELLVLTRK
jgi:SAM-dependent methyltransferase